MAYTRRILCLAASRKRGGYCYAGKDIRTGEWIRPVSARADQEIRDPECILRRGIRAKVLDILEIPFLRPTPSGYQSENHLIDPNRDWEKVREGDWDEIEDALDEHDGPLWRNGSASGGFYRNRVPEAALTELEDSLVLIRPTQLRISIAPKGGLFDANKRLVKARFAHNELNYTLAVTDPVIERRFRAGPDRIEDMTGAVLCVSLGEVHRGHAYKLVAAVIEPPEEG